MQPIQINVSVNIGVTDGLLALLTPMFNRPQVEAPAAAPAPRTQRASKQQPVVENPEPQPGTEAKTEAPEPAPAEPAAPAEQPAQNKEYTEVDVRAAMHKVRQRIEGENYKEQPDSEGYKKWHKVLTGWFKNTAAFCGAEKPSALPDSQSRYQFIQCCEHVKVENDELVEDCPF